MIRYHILVLWLLALAIASSTCGAQPIETESGPIEFIGLKRWSPRELWEKLYALAPGEGAHACANTLKQDLQFPDAAVYVYPNADTASEHPYQWVVAVVEPEDSARVSYRAIPSLHAPTIERWRKLGRLLLSPNVTMQGAMMGYPKILAGDSLGAEMDVAEFENELRNFTSLRVDRTGVRDIWRRLGTERSRGTMDLAMRTLTRDGNDTNRAAAMAMLMNFPNDDRAIIAAMNARIDPQPAVSAAAGAVLGTALPDSSRVVDWGPATGSLRRILGGTNLAALLPTMIMLARTHISPALAAPLLAGNGEMILAYAAAHHDDEREAALALLRRLSGKNLGDDVAAWRSWIAGLPPASSEPRNGADNRRH